ncbi:MAG: tautomerase family protein [Planctomycetota bacterium]|jgi:4-oxalocrotonate tautomerase
MSIIIFEGPVLEVGRKREPIRSLTDAAAGATGLAPEKIVTILHENGPERVGVAGELLADRLARGE